MRNLEFISSSGDKQAPTDANGTVSLAAGTYYAELEVARVEKHHQSSVHWLWGATLAAVVTYEATDFPELTSHAAAASGWEPTAYPTLTITAGAADQEIARWKGEGSGRVRAKIVVSVAGTLRGAENHKVG